MSGGIFVVAAPSGAGKTTLVRKLVDSSDDIVENVSHTTRPMRDGEKDGVDYHFRSQEDFRADERDGKFIESFQVFSNHYGTAKEDLENLIENGNNVILILDCKGAYKIKETFGEQACTVFVKPPSLEVLENRLVSRGTDSEAVIAKRLGEAKAELEQADNFDKQLVNDDIDTAVEQLRDIVKTWGSLELKPEANTPPPKAAPRRTMRP